MTDTEKKSIPTVEELLAKGPAREKQVAQEIRDLFDVLISKMAEGLGLGLVCNFAINNGSEDGKPSLDALRIEKRVHEYLSESFKARNGVKQ